MKYNLFESRSMEYLGTYDSQADAAHEAEVIFDLLPTEYEVEPAVIFGGQ